MVQKLIATIVAWLRQRPRGQQLMIGWDGHLSGWTTYDIAGHADYQGNITDLFVFPDQAFAVVYASHVLEHVDYFKARQSLSEIFRVLQPGGTFYVAVPDVENLARGLKNPNYAVVRNALDVIFGVYREGSRLDDHKYGYTYRTLKHELEQTGFVKVRRFTPFLDDCTRHQITHRISSSLNLVCQRP